MKDVKTTNTARYGYALKDAVSVTWLDGAKTLTAAKRAATHREPGGELRIWRWDDATWRHYLVSTRRNGEWVDEVV